MLCIFINLQICFVTQCQIQFAVRFYTGNFCFDDLPDMQFGMIFVMRDQCGLTVVHRYECAEIVTEFIDAAMYDIITFVWRIFLQ